MLVPIRQAYVNCQSCPINPQKGPEGTLYRKPRLVEICGIRLVRPGDRLNRVQRGPEIDWPRVGRLIVDNWETGRPASRSRGSSLAAICNPVQEADDGQRR
jgi:hypothetical protein